MRKDAEISYKGVDVRASKGAAGMLAIRLPSTASPQTMELALNAARDVTLEGIKQGMSSATVKSSGGAAGALAAVEVYDTQGELHSDWELKQLPESGISCCLYTRPHLNHSKFN